MQETVSATTQINYTFNEYINYCGHELDAINIVIDILLYPVDYLLRFNFDHCIVYVVIN